MFNPKRGRIGDLVTPHGATETWLWDPDGASSGIAVVADGPVVPGTPLVVVGIRPEPMDHDPHRTWLLVLTPDGIIGEVLSDSVVVTARTNG